MHVQKVYTGFAIVYTSQLLYDIHNLMLPYHLLLTIKCKDFFHAYPNLLYH